MHLKNKAILLSSLILISLLTVTRPVHAFCAGALVKEIQQIAQNPEVIEAVKRADANPVSQAAILEIDQRWIAQKGKIKEADQILANQTSRFLANEMSKKAYFREAILTGKRGETLAMNDLTSDYWQGDEDKFIEIFDSNIPSRKPDSYISRARWDNSTSAMIAQISVPVYDGTTMIGTLTVGVDLKRVPAHNH